MQREKMEYDVVIVGAGPAGLSAAIRLKQRAPNMKVCVLEKGAEVGAHILSGAAFDPKALNELIPDWKARGAPLLTPAAKDEFLFLTPKRAFKLPILKAMSNDGCYVISLGKLTRWLGQQAEQLGVEIFAGFPAADVIIEDDRLCGVITGEMGRGRDGKEKANFQPGVEIRAPHTLLAEGCRGFLSEHVMRVFGLRHGRAPQTYGIGIKEVWEVAPEKHVPGKVVHSFGWPLDARTYGGSFLYHQEDRRVAVGFITGLDYENPHLDPYMEFQRFKTHPAIRDTFQNARRIEYGARALNEGGVQAVPGLAFPGGALIGCAAGFVNVARIKGSHLAMKTGMLAADAIIDGKLEEYPRRVRKSWVHDELWAARNVRPAFQHFGQWLGLIYVGIDQLLYRGRAPWTLPLKGPDHRSLKNKKNAKKIDYPKPDGVLTFDRMASVYISNTHHEEDQPCHLLLADAELPVEHNLPLYDAPEQRYCPAGVYEIVQGEGGKRLQINAANCVHCKTCDIKDPTQNILWVTPEGGGGPNYSGM